ncbi:MAG: hypothetical protein V1493_01995 [Candidatus Diapherotrites archaeon]
MVDIGNVIRFSFSWYKDREFLKYALMYWGVFLVFGTAVLAIVFALFGGYLSALMANSGNLLPSVMADATSGALLGKVLGFAAAIFVLCIVWLLCYIYIDALMMLFALRAKGFSHPKFHFSKVFGLIGLGILAGLAAMFYSFDEKLRKWHWLSLAGVVVSFVVLLAGVLFLPSAAGTAIMLVLLGLLLLFVCFLAYFYFVFVNSLRMAAGMVIFLQAEKGIVESLKESFGLTKGHLIEIFVCNLVVPLIMGIAAMIFVGIFAAIFGLALSPFLPSISLPVTPTAESSLFPGFRQASTSLSTAFFVSNQIASFLFAPFSLLVAAFMAVGIYSELLNDKSAPAAGAAAPSPPK